MLDCLLLKYFMPYMDIKILVVVLAVIVLAILIARYRKKSFFPLALALVIALPWCVYFRYEYEGSNFFLFDRINVYPLILWTIGLTTLQLLSYELPGRNRLPFAIILYLIFLIIAEAIGYHLLNIRLDSHYTSLLNLGVIHAPVTMKVFYIFAGPVYLILLDWINKGRVFAAKTLKG